MYKYLNWTWLIGILMLCSITVGAQSTIGQGMEYYKNRNYSGAILEFNNSLNHFKNFETPILDSVAYIYEHLQFCYSNRLIMDSCSMVQKEAEQYFLQNGDFQKHIEFKFARAETEYMIGDYQTANDLFASVLDQDKVLRSSKLRAHLRIALIQQGLDNKEQSYTNIAKSLELALQENDQSFLGNIYDTYGTIENTFGEKRKAIDYYLKAIPYLKGKTKQFLLASVHRKIGSIFESLGNDKKAFEYFSKGLDYSKEFKIVREQNYCLTYLGHYYLKRGNYDKAIEAFNTTLKYFKRRRIKSHLVSSNGGISTAYLYKGDLKKAKLHLDEGQKYLVGKIGTGHLNKYHLASLRYYMVLKNKNRAAEHFSELNKIYQNSSSIYLASPFLKIKSQYERAFGNFEEALKTLDIRSTLQDSVHHKQQNAIVHDLESKYRKKEQDKEIALLNSENELKASRLSKQRIIIFGGAIALIIFGLLSMFIYRLYKKVQSQNGVIQSSLLEKDTLLREIHHRVKNNLQVISSLLALQSKYVLDDVALSALKEGQDRVQTMALIHQDLYENEDMTGVNTHIYLEQLVENLFDSYNINEDNISYILDVDEIIMDVDTMIPLGLIINELVSNALKHAFKEQSIGEITVRLKEKNDHLHLEISDNGKGISSLAEIEGQSFGFELINAFAKKLRAEMNITSETGLKIQLKVQHYKKAA